MISFREKAKQFATNENGATAIEYALIAAVIGLAVISAFQLVATSLSNNYSDMSSEIDSAI